MPNWSMLSETESHEFVHIWSNLSPYLNVDIALDDDGQYEFNHHPICIYFRNGYHNAQEEWLPLLVSETECSLPLSSYSLKISVNDFMDLCEFVKMYHKEIKALADGRLNLTQVISIIDEGRYRLIRNGRLISKVPFDFVDKFFTHVEGERAFARIGNETGYLYADGKFVPL